MSKKRKKGLAAVNTEGWMMSYADMATILLAMFIVLSTLGKDQTGVSLNKGLESFRESQQSFGLSGILPYASKPNKFASTEVDYNVKGDGTGGGTGNPTKGPTQRSIDQELEQFQRFLKEVGRPFKVDRLPSTVGQATVDFFDPVNKNGSYWTGRHQDFLAQIVPLLRRSDYRVVLTVWAPMAKESAMLRSADTAKQLASELAATAQLNVEARARLIAVAQTWPHADYQRPVVSLTIARTVPATSRP